MFSDCFGFRINIKNRGEDERFLQVLKRRNLRYTR